MDTQAQMAIVLAFMIGTWLVLLRVSKRYRDDTAKVFRLEKTKMELLIGNPVAAVAHLLSFVVPLALMDLL